MDTSIAAAVLGVFAVVTLVVVSSRQLARELVQLFQELSRAIEEGRKLKRTLKAEDPTSEESP